MGWLDNVKAAVKQVFDEYENKPEEKEVPKEEVQKEPELNDVERIVNDARKQTEMINGNVESSISNDTFTNVKWGTPAPIMVNNLVEGPKQITVRGLCEFKIVDREKFSAKFNYDFSNYDESAILSLVNSYIIQELSVFLRSFPTSENSTFMLISMGMNFSRRVSENSGDTGIKFITVSVQDIHYAE